ncbi:uncharacterized protein A4U43_C03F90 [Asparagus officinalis]|uniref:K Homology domain-containing protein n=1 Tax=Asparagus officinalis TaxID=4686 RepID=A0A5P1F8W1_ASPOF|nr:uncharacterized protein A4U43_C03F90 [Asparagus officinalis]
MKKKNTVLLMAELREGNLVTRELPTLSGKKILSIVTCVPGKKIGRIIGRGGENVRKLMASSEARIVIGKSMPGSEEQLVTIFSSSNELDAFGDRLVCLPYPRCTLSGA